MPGTRQRVVDRKIAMITDYLTKTGGLDPKGFKIVVSDGLKNMTKLYVIMPGVDFPSP